MRIPIETAHLILATFGITKPTRAYERWVKNDGFDVNDFGEVLGDSVYIFAFDWRGTISEDLECVRDALSELGVSIEFAFEGTDDSAGLVECNGRKTSIRYAPNDDATNWLSVIQAIQGIMPSHIEFRESTDNGGADTDIYAVLPVDEWDDLERQSREAIRRFFRPLGGDSA